MEVDFKHSIGDQIYLIDKNKIAKATIGELNITGSPKNPIILYKVLRDGHKTASFSKEDEIGETPRELFDRMERSYFKDIKEKEKI